jgi:hypothetical protein
MHDYNTKYENKGVKTFLFNTNSYGIHDEKFEKRKHKAEHSFHEDDFK